jgi:hypothetical protein
MQPLEGLVLGTRASARCRQKGSLCGLHETVPGCRRWHGINGTSVTDCCPDPRHAPWGFTRTVPPRRHRRRCPS